jgi:hypothetical protein
MAAFGVHDNVRETFTGAGLTTITLGGNTQGSRTFASKYASGDPFWGVARILASGEIVVGRFTYNGATITQTEPKYSSNGDAAVSFSSGGAGEVYVDLPAFVLDHLNLVEEVLASGATTDLGSIKGLCIELQGTTNPTSFGASKNKQRIVRYSGAGLTITNGSTLVCPGAQNLTLATGDIFYAISDNTVTPIWRIMWVRSASGKVYLPVDGTAALPAQTWASDPDTGIYRIGANNIGVTVAGAKVLDVSASGLGVNGGIIANASPLAGGQFDTSQVPGITCANGASAHITPAGTSSFNLTMVEYLVAGYTATFLCKATSQPILIASTNVTLVSGVNVASKISLGWDGTQFSVYNNAGIGTVGFIVTCNKIN